MKFQCTIARTLDNGSTEVRLDAQPDESILAGTLTALVPGPAVFEEGKTYNIDITPAE